ncbi:MAG: NeuD/PglB/VioB family sugar acetyltransferase [Phycisphaerae bacterium]
MTELAIFGAGGLGRLVYDILLPGARFRPVAFLDSDPRKHGRTIDGLTVRGGIEQVPVLRRDGVTAVTVAIGDSHVRVRLAELLRQQGMCLVSAIHPLASIARSARLGDHLIAGARTIVCVHAAVGDHCVLSTGSIVEHDNRLGTGVFLHPAVRLAGGVKIDDYATLGIGACVIPYRWVGSEARVEPGGVVIRDVLPGTTVGGAPATRRDGKASRFVPDDGRLTAGQAVADNLGRPEPRLHSLGEHESG